jgi:lipopolysaccharide transport system ATP-binding protein
MSNRDVVIRVENVSKLYRLGEVGTGSLAHDLNRWWHRVRGKEDPYLKIGEVNDRTRPVSGTKKKSLTTEDTESTEGTTGLRLGGQAGAEFPNPSTSELAPDSENTSLIRSANAPGGLGQKNGLRDDAERKPSENFNLKTENSSPKAQSDWVYALKDVSFEVKRGEVLGIIGRNGAGKSTLLKILSRVTQQTEGRIKVRGRIASLLEVGTGFHPELTGRENIFLNGAILGMRKAEIARKFDEIVEFSGCARYIDTPVKRYSSGMYVRLAFAVAAHLEPEILIVDEVLAVGDAEFQKKCLGKMKDVAGHGRTILFVSHNIGAVSSLCSKGLYLKNGIVHFAGDINKTISSYLEDTKINGAGLAECRLLGMGQKVRFLKIEIDAKDGVVRTGDDLVFNLEVLALDDVSNCILGVTFFTNAGVAIATMLSSPEINLKTSGKISYRITIHDMPLVPGNYYAGFSIGLMGLDKIKYDLDVVLGMPKFEVAAQLNTEKFKNWSSDWGSISLNNFTMNYKS